MSRKKVIIVEDSPFSLNLCTHALNEVYEVYPASSAEKMFEILTDTTPDLILLDVEMPHISGFDAMHKLKENNDYKEIPVIFLSAMDDVKSETEGLNLGAVDYIYKPFESSLLIKRIERHIAIAEEKKEAVYRMGNELRTPLKKVIEMIDLSLKSNDITEIRQYLENADMESEYMLDIINFKKGNM